MLSSSNIFKVHLALLSVSLIYGVFYIVVKLLLQQVGYAELILLRIGGSALVALLIEVLFIKSRLPHWKTMLRITSGGLVGVFLVQALLIIGIGLTTAFHGALIIATVPVWTLALSIAGSCEAFSWRRAGGIALAFAGVVLLLLCNAPESGLPANYWLGDGLLLLSAIGFAWFLTETGALLNETGLHGFSVMAWRYASSAIAFGALYWIFAKTGWYPVSPHAIVSMDATGWWITAFVVVVASVGTYALNNFTLRRTAPSIVGAYIFLQPVLTAILGAAVLGETFYPAMALATGMVFGGVLLATLPAKQTSNRVFPAQA